MMVIRHWMYGGSIPSAGARGEVRHAMAWLGPAEQGISPSAEVGGLISSRLDRLQEVRHGEYEVVIPLHAFQIPIEVRKDVTPRAHIVPPSALMVLISDTWPCPWRSVAGVSGYAHGHVRRSGG